MESKINDKVLLKAGFKEYNAKNDEPILFQKRISDKKGIQYFINCYKYVFPYDKERITWQFELQTENKYGVINTVLFHSDKIIEEVELYLWGVWQNYGSNYYEKFVNCEVKE